MTLAQSFSVFEPEIWSPRVNFFLKQKLVAAKFFDNYSDEVVEGGDRIHIPGIAEMTVSAINTTSGAVTPTNISDTKTTLLIDTWNGASFFLSDFQAAQVAKSYRLKEEYAKTMGYACAKAVDNALIGQAVNLTPSVGDSTTLLATTIEKAFGILESYSVPKEDCTFFVHPKVWYDQILSVSKYYDASQFGKAVTPIGTVDTLYGVPVVITPLVDTTTYAGEAETAAGAYRNFIASKNAFVYALGNLPGGGSVRLQEKTNENLGVYPTADVMFGVKTLNATRGVKVLSDIA